ncbi:hypothetical protein H2200_011135 [Cladophialophora chaetospira]|uniref:Uncharacterized protein n=1 Tax=Cladophialophora chaetospira TaxID=386627 RepID=A0AA38X029_9EURO|nr:hypothetical protein H2200_011135 [Cladophialophora chaetospira]
MAANHPEPPMESYDMLPMVEWILDLNPENMTHSYNDAQLLRTDELGNDYLEFVCPIPPSAANHGEDFFSAQVCGPQEFDSKGKNVISFEYLRRAFGWTEAKWDNTKDLNSTWIKCMRDDGQVVMVAKHCPDGTDKGEKYYKIMLTHMSDDTRKWMRFDEEEEEEEEDENAPEFSSEQFIPGGEGFLGGY